MICMIYCRSFYICGLPGSCSFVHLVSPARCHSSSNCIETPLIISVDSGGGGGGGEGERGREGVPGGVV